VDIGHREGAVDDAAILTVGAGGYIGGRSLEKVAGAATPPKRAGFPFMRGSDRKG